jgi:hypothetical protein
VTVATTPYSPRAAGAAVSSLRRDRHGPDEKDGMADG